VARLSGSGPGLGVDVVRYSFIVMDFHHLLPAGLPAHTASLPEADMTGSPSDVAEGPKAVMALTN